MSKRGRFIVYGSAIALVLAGTASAAFVAGVAGQILAMVLIGTGLVILTGLVFMEVGLSEDRERARERGRGAPAPPRRRLDDVHIPRVRGPRHER
ncbi:MAG TPA: hypothetical protein VG186_12150 [Solirubrobacteraceae bacterium]|nr:hypothetical protein [Solirubrobacteraceae bacterium]